MVGTRKAVVDNHGFRYYDPEIGRYLTRDPAGYVDGLNVYLYVGNNPVNSFDPMGLKDKLRLFEVGHGGSLGSPLNLKAQATHLGMRYNKTPDLSLAKLRKAISKSEQGDIVAYNGHGSVIANPEGKKVPSVATAGPPRRGETAFPYDVRGMLTQVQEKGTAYPVDQMAADVTKAQAPPAMVVLFACDLTATDLQPLLDAGVSVVIASGGEGNAAYVEDQAKAMLDALAAGKSVGAALDAANTLANKEREAAEAAGKKGRTPYTAAYRGKDLSEKSTFTDIRKDNEARTSD